MPRKASVPKEIKAPAELDAAAAVALDRKIKPGQAAEMLKYLMYRRCLLESDVDLTAAGLKLGMSRSALQQAIALLQARLT